MQAQESTEQLLDDAEKAIFRIAEQRLRAGFIPLSVTAEESLKAIEELTRHQKLITGVPTGYPQLDEMTAGLQRGDLIIIAARPSMGKTSLAMNICAHAALNHGLYRGRVLAGDVAPTVVLAPALLRGSRRCAQAPHRTGRSGGVAGHHQGLRAAFRCADLHRRHTGRRGHGDAGEGPAS